MDRPRKDVALVYAAAEDGDGYKILRRRHDSPRVEAGTLRPLRSGRAITGEVVNLEPRRESPLLFDVETDQELSVAAVASPARHGGPAQVATDQYRRGWDVVWGSKPPPPEALN